MPDYIKAERESIKIEVTTPMELLVGNFNKVKNIRFTDYFNQDRTKQGFVVMFDVEVYDLISRNLKEKKKFLAVNVEYIVTATEIEEPPKTANE